LPLHKKNIVCDSLAETHFHWVCM